MLNRHGCFSVFNHLQKHKQRKQRRHYVKLGKKRRESSNRNYYIISPRVIIKAIIIKRIAAGTATFLGKVKAHRGAANEGADIPADDDDCFYYHSWRNNVVIAFRTLSSFLT